MVGKRKVFALAGFITNGLAVAFLIASFASPYWVESNKSVNPSGFERMGLWEACFDDYYPEYNPIVQRRYQGCWAAISHEMSDLYDHFFPSWMQAIQGMATLAVLQMVGCIFLNIVIFIRCCPGQWERYMVFISAALCFLSALFLFISAIMFGVRVKTDKNWLPKRDTNFLSWAFGFCILAAILILVSGMCQITHFVMLRMEDGMYDRNVNTASRRSNHYTTAPPPQSYDLAVKTYDRDTIVVLPPPPSQHQNAGYLPPQPDSSRYERKEIYGKTSTNMVQPPDQSGRYSDSDSDDYGKKSHSDGDSTSKLSVPRQKGRRSKQQYSNGGVKSQDRDRDNAGRSYHEKGSYSESEASYDQPDDVETKSDKGRRSKSDSGRRSRHASEAPPEYRDVPRPRNRSRERSSRQYNDHHHRSEPRSHHHYDDDDDDNDSRSHDKRYSSHSRQNPRYSESRDNDTRSRRSRHGDASPPSSRHGGRPSEPPSRSEESSLYGRRSSSRGRSPSRQTSRRSESHSRQRY